MRIIGIDLHPKRDSMIFDGDTFFQKPSYELEEYVLKLKKENENVLIACDAPLTGPRDLIKYSQDKSRVNDLTKREIEAFFTRGGKFNVNQRVENRKKYKGISVGSYSNLPHWTISKRVFGLPRIGRYCSEKTPFSLTFTQENLKNQSYSIIEVHPGLAIWLYLVEYWNNDRFNWDYKNDNDSFKNIKDQLGEILDNEGSIFSQIKKRILDDDYLDSFIAWNLANDFFKGKNVEIIGDEKTGSFILPKVEGLKKLFSDFLVN